MDMPAMGLKHSEMITLETMDDYKFNFGKYNGREFEDVKLMDPQYVLWCHDEGILSIGSVLLDELELGAIYDGYHL